MDAVTYPEPLVTHSAVESLSDSHVTPLPEPDSHRRRLVGGALVTIAILAALAAAVAWWPSSLPNQPEQLVGIAEQVVIAHLHGDVSTLERLVAIELPETIEDGQFFVRSASAVAVRPIDDGWVVTVAAEALEAVEGGFGRPRTQHYEVVFNDRPTGPTVGALPGLVAAPPGPALRAARPAPAPDDALSAAAHQFLVSGPLADFSSVELIGMTRTTSSDGFILLVEVRAARPDAAPLVFHYSLAARESDVGWQVGGRGN